MSLEHDEQPQRHQRVMPVPVPVLPTRDLEVGRVRIVTDRAGLLGGLLASLTCGGAAAADRLEAMARVMRAEDGPKDPTRSC